MKEPLWPDGQTVEVCIYEENEWRRGRITAWRQQYGVEPSKRWVADVRMDDGSPTLEVSFEHAIRRIDEWI